MTIDGDNKVTIEVFHASIVTFSSFKGCFPFVYRVHIVIIHHYTGGEWLVNASFLAARCRQT